MGREIFSLVPSSLSSEGTIKDASLAVKQRPHDDGLTKERRSRAEARRILADSSTGAAISTADTRVMTVGSGQPGIQRAEVREEKLTAFSVQRGATHDATNRFQEKYAVVVDMKVFDTLSEEQQIEFKKLIHARPDVKFVFSTAGERRLDPVLQELMDFRDRYKNVEIRIDPVSFDFQGRKVIHVSKEGTQAPYADFIERRLSRSKDFYRIRYRESDKEQGLLTAALLLLESRPEEFIRQGRYFSEVPVDLKADIEKFLLSYVYVGRSA